MAQPVSINHDARQITFQLGRVIPPTEARADLHRLLDLAIDALALNAALPEEAHHGEKQD